MRKFKLERVVDVTGISGTGIVAEGVEFSDGTVVVRWLEDGVSEANKARGVKPTTVVHPDIESVTALHGHNGATQVVWISDEPAPDPVEVGQTVERYADPLEYVYKARFRSLDDLKHWAAGIPACEFRTELERFFWESFNVQLPPVRQPDVSPMSVMAATTEAFVEDRAVVINDIIVVPAKSSWIVIDAKRMTWDGRIPTAREYTEWVEQTGAGEFETGTLQVADALRDLEKRKASHG